MKISTVLISIALLVLIGIWVNVATGDMGIGAAASPEAPR